jgi:hypothetical protein
MTMADPYDAARNSVKPAFPKGGFRVFVLGPALKPTTVVRPPSVAPIRHEDVVAHAKYLRYATRIALEKEGFGVDFGETKQMLAFWNAQFGTRDAGSAELLQADKISGAVVVFPSSAGSLCELGMFAPQKPISEKTLAIVHKRYARDKSFFRMALLELLAQENGRYEFRDYSDHQECVSEALKFVAGKYQSLLREYIHVERARLFERKVHGTAFHRNA